MQVNEIESLLDTHTSTHEDILSLLLCVCDERISVGVENEQKGETPGPQGCCVSAGSLLG
jgi:hypothetical protein